MDRIHDVTLWTRPVGQDGLGGVDIYTKPSVIVEARISIALVIHSRDPNP